MSLLTSFVLRGDRFGIFLADRFRLVRFDGRGLGLSDRDVADISFGAFELDLEAVVGGLELRRYAVLGISQEAATAIAHAARHPERVSKLIFDEGRRVAASIPNAKFVSLETENHIPIPSEPAWPTLLVSLETFLSDPDAAPESASIVPLVRP